MKYITISDSLFVDKNFCNENQDDLVYINNKNYYRCKDLIKIWNKYEIALHKIRRVEI
jgi:hypothetical protein